MAQMVETEVALMVHQIRQFVHQVLPVQHFILRIGENLPNDGRWEGGVERKTGKR
jgi:hypothetical protein